MSHEKIVKSAYQHVDILAATITGSRCLVSLIVGSKEPNVEAGPVQRFV